MFLPCGKYKANKLTNKKLKTLLFHANFFSSSNGFYFTVAALYCFCLRMVPSHTCRFPGLVVKASASRAEDPGFESHLQQDFSRAESYQ